MATAINPDQIFEYVLRADRTLADDVPDKTVFLLSALTPAEEAEIVDGLAYQRSEIGHDGSERPTISYRQGSAVLDTLRRGLRGWRKLLDADGKEIVFVGVQTPGSGKRTATDRDIGSIHPKDRNELCNAITEAGRLGVERVGESSLRST